MYFITEVAPMDTRCVGYFKKLEDAIDVVEHNKYDLWEAGCYPYVIIENIPEGVYQYDFQPLWFKYNEKTGLYEKVDFSPDFITVPTVGFGIG